jgi:hypothetical protein
VGGNHEGTLINRQASGSGPLASFPHYDTVEQIYLAPEAVNMLTQPPAMDCEHRSRTVRSRCVAARRDLSFFFEASRPLV